MNRIDAPNGRFYQRDDERFYPSSTTILSVLPMAKYFKEYLLTHTKEEADKILKEAGLQGSKIHHTIELVLRGETISPSGMTKEQIEKTGLISDENYGYRDLIKYLKKPYTVKEDKMMKGFFNWVKEYEPETITAETIVYSDKYKYAGTVDWVGYINIKEKKGRGKNMKIVNKKVLVIVDWKTGKSLYLSHNLQVSSYFKAYIERYKNVKQIKKPKRAFLLQLGVNKVGYKFQEIKNINEDFKHFLHTYKTWKLEHKDKLSPASEYKFLKTYSLKEEDLKQVVEEDNNDKLEIIKENL